MPPCVWIGKWPLDETGRWRMEGAFTLAADLPRGFGERRASILEAGPALLSDWTIGLAHSDSRDLHTACRSLNRPAPRPAAACSLSQRATGRRDPDL